MNNVFINKLCDTIRRERMWRGMTASDLAHQSGISLSYLSKIEHGAANPSIKVVTKIAEILGVTTESLIHGGSHSASYPHEVNKIRKLPKVVRRGERKKMTPANSSVVYELLTPDLQRNLQLILVRHNPGETIQHYAHEGEESIFCLEGKIRITIGDEDVILEPGDCISFDSLIPHSATATEEGPAVLISAQTPPSF